MLRVVKTFSMILPPSLPKILVKDHREKKKEQGIRFRVILTKRFYGEPRTKGRRVLGNEYKITNV